METQKRKRIVPKQKVDRRLLEQELAKRGETFCSASKRLGFTQSYLSAMLSPDGKRDELPKHTIVALYAKFGISAETITPGYEPKEEAVEQPKVEPQVEPFKMLDLAAPSKAEAFANALYDLIKTGAHDGCAQAIKELL